MKRTLSITVTGLIILMLMVPGAALAAKSILGMNPEAPVAIVNGEAIPALEMFTVLQEKHGEMKEDSEDGSKAGKIDYSELLDRLINVRLIIQEARNIGFQELPEFQQNVDAFREQTLISMLLGERMKGLKVDDEEVKKRYEGSAVEWRITSYLFKSKEDAISLVKEVREEGKPLEEAAERYIAEDKATKGKATIYMKKQDLLPEILELVTRMPMGEVSPAVKIEAGFVVLRVDDKRTYDEASIRDRIAGEVMSEQKKKKSADFYKELEEEYVNIDEDLIDGLKFDSEETFEKALKDDRSVANVRDEEPITVGQLTSEIQKKFFHGLGTEKALERAEEKKYDILERMLRKRVFLKEALATGVDKRVAFVSAVKDYENSLLFGAFIQKVVIPDVKLKDEILKQYYDEHLQDYTYPEMMKIHSIPFENRNRAEGAMELLHKGTDFKWIGQNAEGLVPDGSEGLLKFEGQILIASNLPEDMAKAVSGAQPGSYRMYESPEHYFYVLYIEEVTPANPRPFEEVKEVIAKNVFNQRVGELVAKWANDLRKASDIKILIDLD